MAFKMFTDFLEDIASSGENLFNRVKDKDTFRRVVYGAFLIARADGVFDQNERQALAKLISNKLPHFKLDDIMAELDKAKEKIDFDETFGKQEILEDIAKARGDSATLIVKTAVLIGNADGTFDDDEKAETREIISRLNLSASDYGL